MSVARHKFSNNLFKLLPQAVSAHRFIARIWIAGVVLSPLHSSSLNIGVYRPMLLPAVLIGDWLLRVVSVTQSIYRALRTRSFSFFPILNCPLATDRLKVILILTIMSRILSSKPFRLHTYLQYLLFSLIVLTFVLFVSFSVICRPYALRRTLPTVNIAWNVRPRESIVWVSSYYHV